MNCSPCALINMPDGLEITECLGISIISSATETQTVVLTFLAIQFTSLFSHKVFKNKKVNNSFNQVIFSHGKFNFKLPMTIPKSFKSYGLRNVYQYLLGI